MADAEALRIASHSARWRDDGCTHALAALAAIKQIFYRREEWQASGVRSLVDLPNQIEGMELAKVSASATDDLDR